MCFSVEHLQSTQQCVDKYGNRQSVADFPVCIPSKRLRFVSPEGEFNSPTHANAIVYVPGISNNTSTFKEVFSPLGIIIHA